MTEQPRRKDAGVVDDEQIARRKIFAKTSELRVFDGSGVTLQDEQA